MFKKHFFFLMFLLFVPLTAVGEVLFPDPTGDGLNAAYSKTSRVELERQVEEGLPSAEYMMGMIYLSGDAAWGVQPDYEKAFSLLHRAWCDDVFDAGYALSTMYYKGLGVDKDPAKVRSYVLNSGENGHIKSQRTLGLAYKGDVLQSVFDRDIEKSVFWFEKAAINGDQLSAANLSVIYGGDGVLHDEKKSFEWKKKAASAKYGNSRFVQFLTLAEFYEKGVGTDKDLVQAYKYYDLSGSAGVEGKQRLADEMTQHQIDEALRQSQEWQEDHNVQIGGGSIRRVE
ncbi:tetratricopeptide repeat protein [Salinicola aestuarinus]|uniref:tetratricopeptide repeat protein n=1 Tax=Salinicola aestuarinus TaxID=1949082 RepID=UPI00165F9320|nr:tetratricopeptide repeat protein [Salinicola aestuarinus]